MGRSPRCASLALALLAFPLASAQSESLVFKAAGKGLFAFDTGALKGRLKLDGRYQGLYPLIDVASGADLTRPPGVFSPYRVFETGKRYGNAARDWPTVTRLLAGGAVEARWAPAAGHPVEMLGGVSSARRTVEPELGAARQPIEVSVRVQQRRTSAHTRRRDQAVERLADR